VVTSRIFVFEIVHFGIASAFATRFFSPSRHDKRGTTGRVRQLRLDFRRLAGVFIVFRLQRAIVVSVWPCLRALNHFLRYGKSRDFFPFIPHVRPWSGPSLGAPPSSSPWSSYRSYVRATERRCGAEIILFRSVALFSRVCYARSTRTCLPERYDRYVWIGRPIVHWIVVIAT